MYSEPETRNDRKKPSLKRRVFDIASKASEGRLGRWLWPRTLTVVNYHRIEDVRRSGIDSFKPNISASPDDFDQQMTYLKRWFNVIPVEALVDWLEDQGELPPNAAIITFDDGYLDNYVNAYPVLRQQNLPAVIFLTTGHIGTDVPFYWDLAAYCFYHTQKDAVTFSDGKTGEWRNGDEREEVLKQWTESLKVLDQEQKQRIVEWLPNQLGVSIPTGQFRKLMLNWDLVREMHDGGMRFGGHTVSHPILTRIPLPQAVEEIQASRRRVEDELQYPVHSFAYPNGMANDLSMEVKKAVQSAGYRAAFTLLSGPTSAREVRKDPLAIRRIFISHRQRLSDFKGLLTPLNRLRK